MDEPTRVRVLLISPRKRLLLIKYRNTSRSGVDRPCWTTAGGGREPGESLEHTALRELAEETGIAGIRLGPVVWYGEDGQRRGDWNIVYREHFIVAFAPTEAIHVSGWTDDERNQILETRWWTIEEIRQSSERIYPPGLAHRLQPILAGAYPAEPITLPPI